MRRTHLYFVVAGLLLWAGAAGADELVPLVPKMEPAAAAERISQFHDALAQGLKAGGASVVPAATVRSKLKLGLESAGCDEGPCLQTNAALLGSNRLATAKISSIGKNYTIDVRIFQGNAQVAKATGHCDICTHTEALQTLQRLATDLGSKAEEPPPAVVAPRVEPKAEPKVEPKVEPTPPPKPLNDQPPGPAPQRRIWPLWPAITFAAVGVAGIAVGAPLIAIDGNGTNCRGEPRPDKRNCQDLYSTMAGGATLVAIGGASLAASTVFFILHFSSKPKEQPRPASAVEVERFSIGPVPGGMALSAAGRF